LSLTKEIQQLICKAEIQKGNHVAENFNYFFAGELDVISVNKSGYVVELEVKISRADFKADAKKKKWQWYNDNLYFGKSHCPNYFIYVCPDNLIKEDEIKDYQGLIYVKDGELTVIKKPKLIHRHKHDIVKLLTKMLTVNNWKAYFGAQRLTILNREAVASNDGEAKQKLTEVFNNLNNKRDKYCFQPCPNGVACECMRG